MTRDENEVLRWTCGTCGWTCDVPMPGYAGTWDGRHFRGGNPESPCGPLSARLAGYSAPANASGATLRRLRAHAAYVADQRVGAA